jgi:imidazolonepropionase-like amidohydrolase
VFRRRVFGTLLPVSIVAIGLGVAGTVGHADEPGAFAIRNARIVPVAGPAIENGTVVVSGGLITAVGASAEVPAGAWVIDGKGLTVYPGLIDALTDLGLASAAGPAGAGGPGGAGARPGGGGAGGGAAAQATPARGPQDRPASTPWVQAADDVKVDERRFESWRNAGFTTALTAPKTGIFPGQGAVINLAGERAGDLVVASPVTLQINIAPPGGFGGFPGSLMGVYAYVRQVYLDVQHDVDARKQYDASPRGVERPEYDRTVRAVAEAQAAGRPVLMAATSEAQIARILEFSQELKLKPVLYGVHESYKPSVTERLAAKKTPVLVSLKWPERDSNADPEAEESIRVLRLRDKAPSAPAALQKAGVKFAFYSDGEQPQNLLKNARKAVESGLAADAAVKALTLDAAEILGVANRLGSIETGKIANLVVTDGDLFAEKTKVKLVFVDGRKFEVRDTPPPGRRDDSTGAAPAPTAQTMAQTMAGRWNLTANTPNGARNATADITMGTDGALAGSVTAEHGISSISSGSLTGNRFTFVTTVQTNNGPLAITFSGTIDGNTLKGSITSPQFTGDLSGTRATTPPSSNPEDEFFGFSTGDVDDDHSGRDAHGHGHDGRRRGGRQ